MSAALETHLLGKAYRRAWALHDCSLRLEEGTVAALVGPNGAGKTTLLHLAVGLLRPDAGAVSVLGRSPAESLPEVGFVAQETPLYAGFSAADHIEMGARLNCPWDGQFAHERLRELAIPADLAVGKLSGGQRAQVALALALAKRPRLLLLDEPVASLDPLARREFMQVLMGAVAREGTSVLLSSHLLGDLDRVCDYLVLLRSGGVQLAGEVDTLLDQHRRLVGPRMPDDRIPAGVAAVVHQSHTDRQSTLLVRTDRAVFDPAWQVGDVTLEDLVLAYLANRSASALPGPEMGVIR